MSGANGAFTVSGSHTYASPGSFSVAILVTDTTSGQSGTGTATASVAAPVNVSGQAITGTAGIQFSRQVATISDSAATGSSQLNASIDWGDGSSLSPGTVSGANGTFTVSGSHTYAKVGKFTIIVSVTDTATKQTGSGSGTTSVNVPTISVTGQSITATQDVQFTGLVATVIDPAATSSSQFSVTIDWGDSSSSGTVSGSGPSFTISGSHMYFSPGFFPISIRVFDTTSQQGGTGSGGAVVLRTPSQPQVYVSGGLNITATLGVPFNAGVANVIDPAATQPGQLITGIDWGDGSPSSRGTVGGAGGSFVVFGNHTYARPGTFSITIYVSDSTTGANGSASDMVALGGVFSASGQNIKATAGVQFSGQVASVSDEAAAGSGQLSATIDWGDNSGSTPGTVVSSGGISFSVSGIHTYATSGTFTITVTVIDTATNQSGTGAGTATIAAAPVQVSGQNITATRNFQFSGQVATVNDTAATGSGQLVATIDWGDGSTTSTGTVSGSGPGFTISGSHTFASAGSSFIVTTSVKDTTTGQSGSATATAIVYSPPSVSGQNITATTGVQFSGQVATVSDAAAGSSGQLTATIDWGDGSPTSPGTVSGANGAFTISGSHTYATAGSFHMTTIVTDMTTGLTSSGPATATVTAPSVNISGQNITATAGTQFSGQVATVSDAAPASSGQLTASINWGDGTSTSTGTVSGNGPSFTINGSHTYAKAGSFTLTVTVTDTTTGQSGTGTSSASVGAPPMQVSGQHITATQNVQFSGQVATVNDAAASTPGQFRATIDWGDGSSTSAGTVSGAGPSFSVSGSHSYAKAGSFTLTISVKDTTTGQVGSASSTATVNTVLSVSGQNITTTAGVQFSGTLATVTGAAQASDLTATITWGDGSSTSQGTVSGTGSSFSVNGTHTYAAAGSFSITISVKDTANGQTATASATATVAAALSLKVTGQSVSASEGSSYSGGVATGTETGITGALSASISWGDGSTSTGTVTSTGSGTFRVSGTHTYAEEGSYTTSITVSDGNGHHATGSGSTAAADAALQVTKLTVAMAGKVAALAALFIDADSNGAVSDYKATITWGDGTTSAAIIVKNPQGPGFGLAGAHRYAQHGKFTVTLTITDAGGSSVTATQTITV